MKPTPDLYVEVPVAGQNVETLVGMLQMLVPSGSLVEALVFHDDDCPAIGSSMLNCTCEIVGVKLHHVPREPKT